MTAKRLLNLCLTVLVLISMPHAFTATKKSNTPELKIVALQPAEASLQVESLVPATFTTPQADSIWPGLAKQFQLVQHYNQRTAVKNAVRWFLKRQDLLTQVLENAKPYLYYVSQQLKQRQLPGELALLPMIESGYDPFAYSNRTATGLWQMMPTTAADLGSDISWWYDTRRDTTVSTQYALQYLQQLHNRFHNWLLAIAAYDVGQGRVQQAIQYNKSVGKKGDFWSLPLPNETKNYIPKLLALAQIIAHADSYGVSLPAIQDVPYFSIIPIKSQITLTQVAQLANTNESTIQQLNPGLRRWATPPKMTYNLLVPANRAKRFQSSIKKLKGKEQITWIYHEVRSGETLSSIARNYYTTTQVLRKANGLLTNEKITTGQGLLVPIRLHQTFDVSIKPIKINDAALPSEETAQQMQETRTQRSSESNLGQQIRKKDSLKTILDKLYSSPENTDS